MDLTNFINAIWVGTHGFLLFYTQRLQLNKFEWNMGLDNEERIILYELSKIITISKKVQKKIGWVTYTSESNICVILGGRSRG